MIITLRIIRHLKSMVLIKGSAELLWKTFAAILDRKQQPPRPLSGQTTSDERADFD